MELNYYWTKSEFEEIKDLIKFAEDIYLQFNLETNFRVTNGYYTGKIHSCEHLIKKIEAEIKIGE